MVGAFRRSPQILELPSRLTPCQLKHIFYEVVILPECLDVPGSTPMPVVIVAVVALTYPHKGCLVCDVLANLRAWSRSRIEQIPCVLEPISSQTVYDKCQIVQAEHMNMTVRIDCIVDNDAIMDAGPAHRLIP